MHYKELTDPPSISSQLNNITLVGLRLLRLLLPSSNNVDDLNNYGIAL